MGQADLEALLAEREVIEVGCEFCSAHYLFNHQDVSKLFLQEKRH
jgi:molecular chaperone Hsp33